MDGGTTTVNGCPAGQPSQNPSWEQAVTVKLNSILYMHCHQDHLGSGTLVMVGVDGIQYPPLNFPPGDNLLTFLGCLEISLLPDGLSNSVNNFLIHLLTGVLSPPLKTAQGSLGQPCEGSSGSKSRKNSKDMEGSKDATMKNKSKDAVFKIVYTDKVFNIEENYESIMSFPRKVDMILFRRHAV